MFSIISGFGLTTVILTFLNTHLHSNTITLIMYSYPRFPSPTETKLKTTNDRYTGNSSMNWWTWRLGVKGIFTLPLLMWTNRPINVPNLSTQFTDHDTSRISIGSYLRSIIIMIHQLTRILTSSPSIIFTKKPKF